MSKSCFKEDPLKNKVTRVPQSGTKKVYFLKLQVTENVTNLTIAALKHHCGMGNRHFDNILMENITTYTLHAWNLVLQRDSFLKTYFVTH